MTTSKDGRYTWLNSFRDKGEKLSAPATLVGYALFSRADEKDWKCFPSIPLIMRDTRIKSARTVHRSIAELVAAGWITYDPGDSRTNNRYWLTYPDLVEQEMPYVEQEMPVSRAGDALGVGQEMPSNREGEQNT
jgi:hypothetical protein